MGRIGITALKYPFDYKFGLFAVDYLKIVTDFSNLAKLTLKQMITKFKMILTIACKKKKVLKVF